MLERIKEASQYLRPLLSSPPEIGMITGTGLGGLTDSMETDVQVPYPEFPEIHCRRTQGNIDRRAFGGETDPGNAGPFSSL